jgi:tetratricopeptide (TPR) repeat protein
MTDLDGTTQRKIADLSDEGNALLETSRYQDALAKFSAALDMVPEPHSAWEAATWLYVSIGEVHFQLRDFKETFRCFANAVQCPKGLGNPFIHLRLGQASFELGDFDRAADELTRAYKGGELEILLEDDPKYLAFLETRIDI